MNLCVCLLLQATETLFRMAVARGAITPLRHGEVRLNISVYLFFLHMWYNVLLIQCFINSWEVNCLQVSEEGRTIDNLHIYVVGVFKGKQGFKSCPVGDEVSFKVHFVSLFARITILAL